MATKTFTQLTAVTSLAAGDELVQWNASAGAARKITVANFIANSPNGGLAELGAAKTFTAKMTFSSGIGITGGSYAVATIYKTATDGVLIAGDSGSANDLVLINGSGGTVMENPTGTLHARCYGALAVADGITPPATAAGWAYIYVDSGDGDLKVKFGDGTVATIAVDT